MAIKFKSGAPPIATPLATVAPRAKLGLTLPEEPNVPSSVLSDYTMLLYGAKKIGKTSLASRFPNAIFLALEPGTKALSVFSRPVKNFNELLEYVELLEKDTRFATIVVDTVDIAYEYAFEYICKKKSIAHPSEEDDFGATWGEIKAEFKKIVLRLMSIGKGIIFISHDTERKIELRDGKEVERVQPTMSSQAMGVVEALVDIIMNYSYDGNDRILRLDGSHTLVAGNRIEEHFIRKGGAPRMPGDKIRAIHMGLTSQEAYNNFINAFNNEQDVTDPTEIPKTPTMILRK
jgi:hypothetical protein